MDTISFRSLRADEVELRVGTISEKGASFLLYKDARCDMNVLDETVGPHGWQRVHELIDGKLFCNVGIRVDWRGDGYGEWVWKQDVGVESYTEKEKGQASDSFKRACFNWGIGRELYTAPFIWISKDKISISKNDKGRYVLDYSNNLTVETLRTGNGKIVELTISNNGKVVYTFKVGAAKNSAEVPVPVSKPQDTYKCEICGDAVPKDLAIKSMNKYGHIYCSKECKDKGEA